MENIGGKYLVHMDSDEWPYGLESLTITESTITNTGQLVLASMPYVGIIFEDNTVTMSGDPRFTVDEPFMRAANVHVRNNRFVGIRNSFLVADYAHFAHGVIDFKNNTYENSVRRHDGQ